MRGKLTLALFCAGSITIAGNIRAQESGIAVGSAAPAVSVRDLDGNTVDLGQYIGKKPMLLEFWATWCELCEELLPRIRAAKAAYGLGRGVHRHQRDGEPNASPSSALPARAPAAISHVV